MEKNQRGYDLNCILEQGFELKIEPTTGISKVLVTSIRVTLQEDRKPRIVVEADPFNDNRAVYTLLQRLSLPSYDVTGLCEKTLIPNPRGEDRGVPIRTTAAHGLCCSWIFFLGS